MDMSDDKDYYERYQKSKNDEEIVTDDIEVFKQGKLSSKKNNDNIKKDYDERVTDDIEIFKHDNIKKDYDERNRIDMSDEKDYGEIRKSG